MKLTDVKTPFGEGKVTSISTWGSILISVIVTFIALAIGQNLAKKIEKVSGGKIDATLDPITKNAEPKVKVEKREVL